MLFWRYRGGGLFRMLFFLFFGGGVVFGFVVVVVGWLGFFWFWFCLVRGMMDGRLHLIFHVEDDAIGILE